MAATPLMPDSTAYQEALQNPKLAFRDPGLKGATADLTKLGLPRPISGAFACVFTLRTPDNRRWAIKCFTKSVDDRRARYSAISGALSRAQVSWKVHFEYEDEAILVNGRWWPLVKMEWFDAPVLSSWVADHRFEPIRLRKVAEQICTAVGDLERLGWSHGDLQHGNILVADDDSIRLIDYDGMFVPDLIGRPPTESGHRHYQHPDRRNQTFGPHLDRFSGWMIALGLLGIAADPALLDLNPDPAESILFRSEDYASPHTSALIAALSRSLITNPIGELAARIIRDPLDRLGPPSIQGLSSSKRASASWLGTPSTSVARPAQSAAGAPHGAPTAPRVVWAALPPRPLVSIPTATAGAKAWLPPTSVAPVPVTALPGPVRFADTAGIRSAWIGCVIATALGAATTPFLGLGALLLWHITAYWLWQRTPEQARYLTIVSRKRHLEERLLNARQKHQRHRTKRDEAAQAVLEYYELGLKELEMCKAAHTKELDQINDSERAKLQAVDQRRKSLVAKHRSDSDSALKEHEADHIRRYLAGHNVSTAPIPVGSQQQLNRCGIHTAADFLDIQLGSSTYGNATRASIRLPNNTLRQVPSIGPVRAQALLRWREGLVRRVPAAKGVPPEKARLDSELARAQVRLDQEVEGVKASTVAQLNRPTKAMTMYNSTLAELRSAIPAAEVEVGQLDQALSISSPAVAEAEVALEEAKRELAAVEGLSFGAYVGQVWTGRSPGAQVIGAVVTTAAFILAVGSAVVGLAARL